jgi:hypothetical protein
MQCARSLIKPLFLLPLGESDIGSWWRHGRMLMLQPDNQFGNLIFLYCRHLSAISPLRIISQVSLFLSLSLYLSICLLPLNNIKELSGNCRMISKAHF